MKINITVKDLYNLYKNNDKSFLDSITNTYIINPQDWICEIKSESPNSQFEISTIDITTLYHLNDDIEEIILFCKNNPINFSRFGYNIITSNDVNTFIPIFISVSLYFGYNKEQIEKVLPTIFLKIVSKCAYAVRESTKILNKLLSNINDNNMSDIFDEMLPNLKCDYLCGRWDTAGLFSMQDISNSFQSNPYKDIIELLYNSIQLEHNSINELINNIIKNFPYKRFIKTFVKKYTTHESNIEINRDLLNFINNTIDTSPELFESIVTSLTHKMDSLKNINFLTAVCIVSISIQKSGYFNQMILAC